MESYRIKNHVILKMYLFNLGGIQNLDPNNLIYTNFLLSSLRVEEWKR